jgi:hypothetical protein
LLRGALYFRGKPIGYVATRDLIPALINGDGLPVAAESRRLHLVVFYLGKKQKFADAPATQCCSKKVSSQSLSKTGVFRG